jgi:hypothetical protein
MRAALGKSVKSKGRDIVIEEGQLQGKTVESKSRDIVITG